MSDASHDGYTCHGPMIAIPAPGTDAHGEPIVGAWFCDRCGVWRHAFPSTETQLRALMEARMTSLLAVFRPVVVLLLLLVPVTAFADGLKLPTAVLIGAQSADLVSTHHALQRPGTYEANGIMHGSDAKRIALKALGTAGIVYGAHYLAAKGKPKTAKILLYSVAGASAGIALHNMRGMR